MSVEASQNDPAKGPHLLKRLILLLDWLPHYRLCWLRNDFLAGVTVWAVMVPTALYTYPQILDTPLRWTISPPLR